MAKKLYIPFCTLFFAISFPAFSQCAKYEPPDGKVLFVLGQDCNATGGTVYGTGYVDDAQIATLPKPGGVTTYYSISLSAGAGLNTLADYGAGPIQASQYLGNTHYSNSVICIGLYMTDGNGNTLNVPAGSYNTHLDALANWIKSVAPRPVFLRIGYEFETQYVNSSTNYKNAYRYIVDRFRSQSVDNVAYVWQAAAGNSGTTYLYNWYPGDSYVDWMGYSHFEYGGNQFEGNDIFTLARTYRKPVMIAEATPRGYNLANSSSATNAWNNYFARLFTKINNNIDVVKALCYINQDWEAQSLWNGQGWGNSRIQANGNGTIEANWIAELSKPHWLHASASLFSTLENSSQSPFNGTAKTLPGLIEAEEFDLGCMGTAYYDNTGGNNGNSSYRYGSSADVGTTSDGGGGLCVAYTSTGEWLEYSVNASVTASYRITFRVATLNAGNSFHIEVDGSNVSGAIAVPVTAGWETYTNLVIDNVNISAGNHVIRIIMDNVPGFNLNHFQIDLPAPVVIGNWQATRQDPTKVQLNWFTYQEINNDGFEIQRSEDGTTFTVIAFLDGMGDSNSITYYQYLDESANASVLYYRLKQIDLNQSVTYSDVVQVQNTSIPTAFPMPFQQTITLRNLTREADVSISNVRGQVLFETHTYGSEHHLNFPMETGWYFITIRTEQSITRIPVIKGE